MEILSKKTEKFEDEFAKQLNNFLQSLYKKRLFPG
jgi:hypothetical protein